MKTFTDDEAIAWAIEILKGPDPKTDGGCTFAPNLNFKEWCRIHDVMINYNQGITNKQAHRILRKGITESGWPTLARLYWAGTTFSTAVGGPLNAFVLIVVVIGLAVLKFVIL